MHLLDSFVNDKRIQGILISIFVFLICYIFFKLTRRLKSVEDVKIGTKFHAFVKSVSDGDGFQAIHIPAINIFLNENSIKIRLAGMDAPETRCFHRPAQPLSKESKIALSLLILKKKVFIHVLSKDQYNRLVSFVYLPGKYFWRKKECVNIKMVEIGMACIYDRGGAEYGNHYTELIEAENKAKSEKIGMWRIDNFELPMDFKKRLSTQKI